MQKRQTAEHTCKKKKTSQTYRKPKTDTYRDRRLNRCAEGERWEGGTETETADLKTNPSHDGA